ncbi:MAG: hypothetical protein ACP5U1_13815 [Desulfomonilaceae bacterium]
MININYALVAGIMFMAILLTTFSFVVVPGISYGSAEQDRVACLNVCNDPTGDLMFYGGNNVWQLRAACSQRCEDKFWDRLDKEMAKVPKN